MFKFVLYSARLPIANGSKENHFTIMKKYTFILLIFGTTLLSSCSDFQEVTFSGIESMKLTKISQQGAEAEMVVKIKNPNKAAFTIYRSDFDVSLNGINGGKAHLSDNVKIKANSEQTYIFKIKSDFSAISLNDLPKLMSLASSKKMLVGLKGNLMVGKLFVKKSYPVEMSESVPLGLN